MYCYNIDDIFIFSWLILLPHSIISVKQIQNLKIQNQNPNFAPGGLQ